VGLLDDLAAGGSRLPTVFSRGRRRVPQIFNDEREAMSDEQKT
jgi:hypothetical protein